MLLDNEVISLIKRVVHTSALVNIDNIVITPKYISAIDDDRTVFIFQDSNVPSLPFESIGMTRVSVFKSRLTTVETRRNLSIDAVLNHNKGVNMLVMRGDGTKVDYRCQDISKITTPKSFNGTFTHRIQLNAEAVMMMVKGQAAMEHDELTMIVNSKGASFDIADSSSDIFSFHITEDVTPLSDDIGSPNYVFRYPTKLLLSLFKQDTESCFEIAQNGLIKYNTNGLDVIVLPRV